MMGRVNGVDSMIHEVMDKSRGNVEVCDLLSEDKIWSKHGKTIWKAKRFAGTPHFYPVYRYQDFYSYSPLSLILLKGSLRLDRRVARRVSRSDFTYYSSKYTLDRDITRIGGPPRPGFAIQQAGQYAQEMAEAMRKDTDAIESRHPGFTNVILCGGKDSLNLSLLHWKNPVILASQPPNYDLVRKFVTDNGLKYDVIRLADDDASLLKLEILVNCCRNNLEHCRWGPHLRRLSSTFGGKVIFWKGQNGLAIMSPRWKAWTHPPDSPGYVSRIFKIFGGHGEYRFNRMLERSTFTQRYFFKLLWYRGAMWQGAHMSIIRQLTNSLVLSGYHGPAVRRVVCQVDLNTAVQEDVRPIIGRYLHGSPVVYPTTNPGPPPSEIRKGISHIDAFVKMLSSCGVAIMDK